MRKYAAWIEGYGDALEKLGWDPKRVQAIKEMIHKSTQAAHQKNVARATTGVKSVMKDRPVEALPTALAGAGVGSLKKHPISGQLSYSPVETDVLKNLGLGRQHAYAPPPIPQAAPTETAAALRAAGL